MNKVEESLRRIREEAKRRVAEANRPHKPEPPSPKVAIEAVKSALASEAIQLLAKRRAADYVADVAEKMQDVATRVIQRGASAGDAHVEENGSVLVYPNNCKLLVRNRTQSGAMVVQEPPQLRTIWAEGDHLRDRV